MAAGLAVIAGPVPYINQLENEAGVILGTKDPSDMERAMRTLLTNMELQDSYKKIGMEYVKDNLSMGAVSKRIFDILDKGVEA